MGQTPQLNQLTDMMNKSQIDVTAFIFATCFTCVIDIGLALQYDINVTDKANSGPLGPILFVGMGVIVAGVPLYYAIRLSRLWRNNK